MVRVTIVSPFRDSADKIAAYRDRVKLLWFTNELRVICVEGDSTDNTWALLTNWVVADKSVRLIRRDTGAPRFGPVVSEERFRVLAEVFNAGLDAVDLEWSDYVLFLPSDIEYEPDMLDRLLRHNVDIVSPIVWEYDLFYDTWAFMQHGKCWEKFGRDKDLGTELIPMDTVGGVMLSKANVLRAGVRYTPDAVDRGYCLQARNHGFACWADPTTHVVHPDTFAAAHARQKEMAEYYRNSTVWTPPAMKLVWERRGL